MKRLFIRWVKEDLPHALDGIEKKLNEKNVLDKGGLYLSFNYTKTLEELYGVKDVLHIHGTVDSNEDQIMFGHHDKRPVSENMGTYYGIDELDTLKKGLYKDTESLIQNNQAFFKELDYITDIYSYGFSFSEPDEAYLDEIQKHLKPENVRWHITQYDIDNNPEYENMLKKRGYQIGDVVW